MCPPSSGALRLSRTRESRRPLVVDLLAQEGGLLDRDVTTGDRDRPQTFEIRKRTVNGNARGADKCREIVLGELDLVTLVRRREIEEALRDAARYVEEHEVFDPAGGTAHGASEESKDLPDRARASLYDPEKVITRDRHDLRLAECGDRGRPRGVVEERELAEDRAVALNRDDDLVSCLVRDRDLHRARRDDVEMPRRVITMENDLVACEPARTDVRRDLFAFRVGERAEDRHASENARDRVGVHGLGTIRSERWAHAFAWLVTAALRRALRKTPSRRSRGACAMGPTRWSSTSSGPKTVSRSSCTTKRWTEPRAATVLFASARCRRSGTSTQAATSLRSFRVSGSRRSPRSVPGPKRRGRISRSS